MTAGWNQSVMDSLLSDRGDSHLPEVEELNCLIYRDPMDMPVLPPAARAEHCRAGGNAGDSLNVEMSQSRASIRILVADASRRNISIDRITDIAIDAILAELNRDQS
jgi:hypothetical protein